MYLSYSGWKRTKCQFAYWNSYPNRTPTPGVDDRLGAIFGIVVGRLFEDFYTKELWRKDQPQGYLVSLVGKTIKEAIREETTTTSKWRVGGVILWRGDGEGQNPDGLYANEDEIAADVRDSIARGFRTIREFRLLGPDAKAEVKLDTDIEGHRLGGRADFMMTRVAPHRDRVIIDGKGSRWGASYADKNQLLWYAMLNRARYGTLPDRAGFLFWKFDPPESMAWFDVVESEVDELQASVLATIKDLEDKLKAVGPSPSIEEARKVFLPIAETKATVLEMEQECRFCSYAVPEICPKGALIAEKVAKKKRRRRS